MEVVNCGRLSIEVGWLRASHRCVGRFSFLIEARD